ncbi:MazG family protein [Marinitoga piezophila KA3]|uniref:MazG family protein n=1 Tax=Marinitoga piezophila (strain DSM 14283 / JCM 11233 / KA3) TaxID=443254 RepID=H2J6N0_MARPK|nr:MULTISPECIES: MazG family protein [Marinitoga]AEX86311.1 MazG family protein [Marinitoga piezophila KA3]
MKGDNMRDKAREKFEQLLEIMEELRSEHGCPWDRKQTHESLKPYMIEEAYEVVHAIDENNMDELIEELGDVMLQVVFHSQIARENNEFTIVDVLERINSKMIRRHPHVFKNEGEYSYEQWEKIKAKEKGKKQYSKIGEINKGLPPLMNLRRLIENSFAVDYDPYKEKNIFELLKRDLESLENEGNENNEIELLTHLIYYFVKKERNIDSLLSKAAKEYFEKYKKFENGEDKE